MDPITLALIVGLGSGVLGGIVSQVIAGAFKTRGDTRQINAAAEVAKAAELRWQREQEFEQKKLSYDRIRAVSVQLIIAHSTQSGMYNSYHYDAGNLFEPYSPERLHQVNSDRYVAEVELGLLVPSLKPSIKAAKETIWKLDETDEVEVMPSGEWHRVCDAHDQAVGGLEEEIRQTLAIGAAEKPVPRAIEA